MPESATGKPWFRVGSIAVPRAVEQASRPARVCVEQGSAATRPRGTRSRRKMLAALPWQRCGQGAHRPPCPAAWRIRRAEAGKACEDRPDVFDGWSLRRALRRGCGDGTPGVGAVQDGGGPDPGSETRLRQVESRGLLAWTGGRACAGADRQGRPMVSRGGGLAASVAGADLGQRAADADRGGISGCARGAWARQERGGPAVWRPVGGFFRYLHRDEQAALADWCPGKGCRAAGQGSRRLMSFNRGCRCPLTKA